MDLIIHGVQFVIHVIEDPCGDYEFLLCATCVFDGKQFAFKPDVSADLFLQRLHMYSECLKGANHDDCCAADDITLDV